MELWSLFDFLMPGFLGSEKKFQAQYGKPILMSRDAKSSSKEQEEGKSNEACVLGTKRNTIRIWVDIGA